MAKVKFRQEAINNLSSIWEYTYNEWSENQADEYYHLIKLACSEIGFNPQIGEKYLEIRKQLFGFRIRKHIIFYHLVSDKEIEIIRILHERMDLKDRLIDL